MSLNQLDPKDPDDKVDYYVNWGRYLSRIGETIQTSTWPVVQSGITRIEDNHDGLRARIRVDGGTVGTNYSLTNRIVTTSGIQRDRTITIPVRNL